MVKRMSSLLLLLLFVVGCSSGGQTPKTSAPASGSAEEKGQAAKAPAKVKVNYPAPSMIGMPVQIAIGEGFYKEENLDIEYIKTASDTGVKLVVSGEHDATVASGTAVAAAAQGAPIRLALAFGNRPRFSVIAKPEINSIADLKGKKVGVEGVGGASLSYFLMMSALQDAKLSPEKDVAVVPVGAVSQASAALIGGSVDAVANVNPETMRLKQKGFKVIHDFTHMYFPNAGLAVNSKFMAENPDVAYRFIKATARGLRVIQDNKPLAVKYIAEVMAVTEAEASEIYDFEHKIFLRNGIMAEAEMTSSMEMQAAMQGIPAPAVDKVFDFSLAKKAEQELGK